MFAEIQGKSLNTLTTTFSWCILFMAEILCSLVWITLKMIVTNKIHVRCVIFSVNFWDLIVWKKIASYCDCVNWFGIFCLILVNQLFLMVLSPLFHIKYPDSLKYYCINWLFILWYNLYVYPQSQYTYWTPVSILFRFSISVCFLC